MSFKNKDAIKGKIYSINDRPPRFKHGGEKKDKEGNDVYWGKSLTLQADEVNGNIHKILDKYAKTGQLPAMIKENPQYGDFANVPDYQESLNIVLKANEQFMNLDAQIRAKFDNDPSNFLAFANDEKNLPEMVKLGLAVKKDIPAPSEGTSIPPAPAQAGSV